MIMDFDFNILELESAEAKEIDNEIKHAWQSLIVFQSVQASV